MNNRRVLLSTIHVLASSVCLCPAVAGVATAWDGLALGVTGAAAWSVCAMVRAKMGQAISPRTRFPLILILSAGTVSALALLMEAFLPAMYENVARYLPLMAVWGVLLEWMDTARIKRGKKPLPSHEKEAVALCAVVSLGLVGLIREFLGAYTLFGTRVLPEAMTGMGFLTTLPGVFLLLALFVMAGNAWAGNALPVWVSHEMEHAEIAEATFASMISHPDPAASALSDAVPETDSGEEARK